MDRVLFRNQYLAVIERDGYTFAHEVRCHGVIVAIVPFRTIGTRREFLARCEVCPAHGPQLELCCLTGGLEPGQTVEACAQQEIYEEAGYAVAAHELRHLGQVHPSKSADTVVHLFAVDVTQKHPQTAPGDGSRFETNASVVWVGYDQGMHIADPLFVTAMARLQALLSPDH
jgi:8-oxo-dGTP pyrophosphatase MutT (NUDIX family)